MKASAAEALEVWKKEDKEVGSRKKARLISPGSSRSPAPLP